MTLPPIEPLPPVDDRGPIARGPETRTPAQRQYEQRGWYFYDWASSTFSTTVITVFLGPYLTDVAETAAGADGQLEILGLSLRYQTWFPAMITVSVALQVLLLPVVGAIADRSSHQRRLLGGFAWTGALATMLIFLASGDRYVLGGLLLVVANLAYGASVVVYNSFLPEIATPDERDRVSSRGWGFGYLGGAILLAINLVVFSAHDSFGLTEREAARMAIVSAAIWWAIFTIIPLLRLHDRRPAELITVAGLTEREAGSVLTQGFRQLAATLRELRYFPQTLLFLGAYLLYNDGIQAVIAFASTYGTEELNLEEESLYPAILMVQVVAFAGALLLGRVAGRVGAKSTVVGSLVVWTGAVAVALVLPAETLWTFYLLAFVIGFVLGGSQALSRSLFSQFIPVGREAEYFGLYEIGNGATSLVGSLLITITIELTGSYRIAIGTMAIFFVLGILLLRKVDVAAGSRAAGHEPPVVL